MLAHALAASFLKRESRWSLKSLRCLGRSFPKLFTTLLAQQLSHPHLNVLIENGKYTLLLKASLKHIVITLSIVV